MLESGISIVVIKNFLGHSSILTTQIYAELSQAAIDQKIQEWNKKWFPQDGVNKRDEDTENILAFLDV